MDTNSISNPSNNENNIDVEYHKDQVKYRSGKRWDIFDWASKLLTATIAGGVAIKLVPDLNLCEVSLLILAVLFLGGYAVGWLRLNNFYLQDSLKKLNTKLNRQEPKIPFPLSLLKIFSYEATIVVLTVVSILIIWLASSNP